MDEKATILVPFKGPFQAMGCPCEILLNTDDLVLGAEQLEVARREAQRIEEKYSRYRKGNIVHKINESEGKDVEVDDETAALLDYAAECYGMSGGLFDVTTGALRKSPDASHVGWSKISWKRPFLQLPRGFEIDFGGICKEYAADQILKLLIKRHPISTLVNLGGDIACAGNRLWSVGIEDVARPGKIARTLHLRQGAVATSGMTKRIGHILNPRTGKPIENAPDSVTVAAKTCTEAGFWSTLAILQGPKAESFLQTQSLEFWCYRSS
jgi:thiamine biosynthesis lipoprotein